MLIIHNYFNVLGGILSLQCGITASFDGKGYFQTQISAFNRLMSLHTPSKLLEYRRNIFILIIHNYFT